MLSSTLECRKLHGIRSIYSLVDMYISKPGRDFQFLIFKECSLRFCDICDGTSGCYTSFRWRL